MAITDFPNDAICYILVDIPGVGEFQGTGAIIGPHTILTAAHLVYDADVGATADQVSIYPGFEPTNGTYNPSGALPGLQSIHTIKVADNGELLTAAATQSDFAIIDTSTDLSSYGQFALDPDFTQGDVVVTGYPASNNGNLAGTGGVVAQDRTLSDLKTTSLDLSPGYSGGPIRDVVDRSGVTLPAIAGTVSTNIDGMKLNKAKVALIRHWIASDSSLYAGGTYAPRGLVPQIAGTVSNQVDAASLSSFTYTPAAHSGAGLSSEPEVAGGLSELVNTIQFPPAGNGDITFIAAAADQGATIAAPTTMAPVATFRPNQGFSTGS
ncbi:MAG: trypsin-like serine peptidase [Janthinobacterium lividum]